MPHADPYERIIYLVVFNCKSLEFRRKSFQVGSGNGHYQVPKPVCVLFVRCTARVQYSGEIWEVHLRWRWRY